MHPPDAELQAWRVVPTLGAAVPKPVVAPGGNMGSHDSTGKGSLVGRRASLLAIAAAAVVCCVTAILLLHGARDGEDMAPAAHSPPGQRIEREGLVIEFGLRTIDGGAPRSWSAATASFTIRDAATGQPVRGLAPLAWMWRRGEGAAPDEETCRTRIRTFLDGRLAAKAEVDLNAFLLLALNDDNSISVINPQIALSRTKLLQLLTFAARPADWALQPDRSTLWVTLPEVDGVGVVDQRQLRLLTTLPVGDRPSRVVAAPDGKTVWVANEGDGTITVIDAAARRVRETMAVGGGTMRIVFGDRGRRAFVSSAARGTIVRFDVATMERLGEEEVGPTVDLAASEAAGVVLAATGSGEAVLLDMQRAGRAQRIRLAPGVATAAFDRNGRWAFVLNPARGEVTVLDPSGATPLRTVTGLSAPDALSFTDRYAYVRNSGDANLTLIQLERLEEGGDPTVVRIPMGDKAPAEAGPSAIASAIAPVPAGNGAFIASPADGNLVFYHEGMMAPAGSHQNYGRKPRAVMVLDRSLRETAPGVYTGLVEMRSSGTWEVGLLLDSPRVVHCFEQAVEAKEGEKEPLRVGLTPLEGHEEAVAVGAPAVVRFRIDLSQEGEEVSAEEIDVVALQPPHTWHRRLEARKGGEPGIYEVAFEPPRPGRYQLNVAVPAKGARLGALRPITIHATQPGDPR